MEQLFDQLGFSQAETKLYLALAENGKSGATALAKRVGIPRSTAYSLLDALIEKGLVSKEQEADGAIFAPRPPTVFTQLVRMEAEEITQKFRSRTEAAMELERELKPLFREDSYRAPRIQVFEGRKNIESMLYGYEEDWQRQVMAHDCIWWGYQDVDFVPSYRKWLDHYWAKLLPQEKIQLLSNRSEVEKNLKKKLRQRIIRQLPRDMEFSSTIWVLGEYVVMIMTRQQPHYAFQLRDKAFADNQRTIFQLLWRTLE